MRKLLSSHLPSHGEPEGSDRPPPHRNHLLDVRPMSPIPGPSESRGLGWRLAPCRPKCSPGKAHVNSGCEPLTLASGFR